MREGNNAETTESSTGNGTYSQPAEDTIDETNKKTTH
jgi:hypothetical protein